MSTCYDGIGNLHPPKTMFLRHAIGTAKSEEGTEYELAANFAAMVPIIRSTKTGKWFTLPWPDIIDLAIARGIDADE